MGYTISEKIMARASGNEQVHSDDIVWVDIDRAMIAEDMDAGGGTQHQIQFDVPMAVDEEVYIRMVQIGRAHV